MAFGNLISDGTEIAAGTQGKIFAFDLKSVLIHKVKQVTMWDDDMMSAPSTSPVPSSTLFGYLSSTSAPEFAFSQSGNFLYVFIKVAVYTEASRIGFEFTRNSINPVAVNSKLDVPQPAKALLVYLATKRLAEEDSQRIKFDLEQDIVREKLKLGLS